MDEKPAPPKHDARRQTPGRVFHVLLVLLLLPFVVHVLSGVGLAGVPLARIAMWAIVGWSLVAVATHRWLLAVGLLLGVPAILLGVFAGATPDPAATTIRIVLVILTLGLVIGVFLVTVLRSRRVTPASVSGALCAYLLIGILWSQIFLLVEHVTPGSFAGPGFDAPVESTLFYYSFVTLTTLGYGDVAPLSGAARMLSVLEALVGSLYLVALVAHLVGRLSRRTVD